MSTAEIWVAEEQRLLSPAAHRHEASHTRDNFPSTRHPPSPECNLVKQHCDGLCHKAAGSDPVRSGHFRMLIPHATWSLGTAYLEST